MRMNRSHTITFVFFFWRVWAFEWTYPFIEPTPFYLKLSTITNFDTEFERLERCKHFKTITMSWCIWIKKPNFLRIYFCINSIKDKLLISFLLFYSIETIFFFLSCLWHLQSFAVDRYYYIYLLFCLIEKHLVSSIIFVSFIIFIISSFFFR